MQRFRFRLERILEWQEQQRQIEESRLRGLLHEMERLSAAIAQVIVARTAAGQQIFSAQNIDPGDLVALAEYRLRSTREENALRRSRAECETQVARQHALWQAAERKCRMLNRLKEKRWREHELEEDREMEAFASEMFLARWRPAARSGAVSSR